MGMARELKDNYKMAIPSYHILKSIQLHGNRWY